MCNADADLMLDVVNWLLEHGEHRTNVKRVSEVLDRGGSVWQVVGDESRAYLARRVNPALTSLFDERMISDDAPETHLRNAWQAAWGVEPRPDAAYDHAVKGIESALRAIVSPNDGKATLGRMIGTIRAERDRFELRLRPTAGEDQLDVFVGALDLLWRSQPRHGQPDTVVGVSDDQARDAVSLAAHLLDWIQRGAFRHTDA